MSSSSQPCSFDGNNDIYGTGVRIGLYCQWLATLLITLFTPEEEETVRVLNITINTSIFLGIAVQSAKETNPVEPVIVLFLMCGSLSSLTGNGMSNFSHVSGVFRALFYTALSAYGIWYWFDGLDKMLLQVRSDGQTCDAIGFLGKSRVDGWFRKMGKGLSVAGLVVSVCLIGLCVIAVWKRFQDRFENAMRRPKKQRPQVEIALLVLSGGLIAFSVVVVEYLIRVNGVTGLGDIDAVGQLIPFLIGILELTSIGWKILIKGLFFKKRCWFLFGMHL
ncbi:hypothetical protein L207DRAFT_516732 [Hyaloscypha variabilis F]|uniref:Uncharacterized protein n=1 Tax=Hyaloscypha variabilis (strain UAMH 11265 / GT02V1 / F) TaxID=1149755 RepID=A0A2J6R7S7_HYAVF|nr:hypothetical protein L207DRAFT_516732 [Hyaloscypha variabilis F]